MAQDIGSVVQEYLTKMDMAVKIHKVAGWANDFLAALNSLAGPVPRGVNVRQSNENQLKLGQIEYNLFLQFLITNITVLRAHRVLRPTGRALLLVLLQARDLRDRAVDIRTALLDVIRVEGIDSILSSTLAAQQLQTLGKYLAMKLEPLELVYKAEVEDLDDYFAFHETTVVRTILERLWDLYAAPSIMRDLMGFSLKSALHDLLKRLQSNQGKSGERIRSLTALYRANSGNRAPLDDYYDKLFKQIETAP
jgi:hypothetical protein